MNKKDIPLYALLLVFALGGLAIVKHGTDKAVAKNNLMLAESQAAAVARATPAANYQKTTFGVNERSALKGWATQNYGASFPEKTVAGTLYTIYEEKAKAGGSAKTYLRSGSEIYEIKNIAGPIPESLNGSSVELTGLASSLREASKDRELLVNLDTVELKMIKAPRVTPKSWQAGRSNAVCDGNFCALVIPIDTTGDTSVLPTQSDIYSYIMDGQARNSFAEQSYGAMEYDGLVTDWISVSSSTVPLWMTLPEVSQYISTNNIDVASYDQVVFLVNGGPHSIEGKASLGSLDLNVNGAMYNIPVARVGFSFYEDNGEIVQANGNLSYFSHLYIHETGHNLNAEHDNLLNCHKGLGSLPSECVLEEYGNIYSTMGNGSLGSHFSFLAKLRIGWVNLASLTQTVSGLHTLAPTELPGATFLGVDYGSDLVPEYVFERRESIGSDALNLFTDVNLAGVLAYRLSSTNGWTNMPTDPLLWDLELVDMTPDKKSDYWPLTLRDAVLKIPNLYADTQRGLGMKQTSGGGNNEIEIYPLPMTTTNPCIIKPIKVFNAPNSNDPFPGQIPAQKWPVAAPISSSTRLATDILGNVSDVNSQVMIYKSIVIFNDDGLTCPASDYSFKLKFAGNDLPLISDTMANYPVWGGPYHMTVFAYLPVYGLTYGYQTVTLEVTKLNDNTVFTKDLIFELVP